MGKTDKIIELAKVKTKEKELIVRNFVNRMIRNNESISIYKICKHTGISKSFIMRNKEVLDFVNLHRSSIREIKATTEKQIIKIQKQRIIQLENENKKLKNELDENMINHYKLKLEEANFEIKKLKDQLEIEYKY